MTSTLTLTPIPTQSIFWPARVEEPPQLAYQILLTPVNQGLRQKGFPYSQILHAHLTQTRSLTRLKFGRGVCLVLGSLVGRLAIECFSVVSTGVAGCCYEGLRVDV
jgi:hypothetical protein